MDKLPATTIQFDEAVAAAKADYEKALGTIVYPDFVTGYVGNNSVDVQTFACVGVRVVETRAEDLKHDTGGFLDPYWNIEIVHDPEGLTNGLRNPWMFGPAHEYTYTE